MMGIVTLRQQRQVTQWPGLRVGLRPCCLPASPLQAPDPLADL
jgi:hypothetical protein